MEHELENWGIETRTVTIEEMDEAVKLYNEARADYDGKKAISNLAHESMESAKFALIKLLQSAGKSKYDSEKFGKVTLVDKLQVTTPKDLPSKIQFFGWLEQKFGEDYLAYLSINHQTLNSLYNAELKEAAENGTEFKVPGLEAPVTNTELRFSKSK